MDKESRKIMHGVECCDIEEVHADKVQMVSEQMPPEDRLYDLAELFKAFGDTTRIRILFALFEAEICVCDLAERGLRLQSRLSTSLPMIMCARSFSRAWTTLWNKKS